MGKGNDILDATAAVYESLIDLSEADRARVRKAVDALLSGADAPEQGAKRGPGRPRKAAASKSPKAGRLSKSRGRSPSPSTSHAMSMILRSLKAAPDGLTRPALSEAMPKSVAPNELHNGIAQMKKDGTISCSCRGPSGLWSLTCKGGE